MRILLLTQLLPYPPDSGAKIRCLNVLKHLSANHKVTLLAFTREEPNKEALRELNRYCVQLHVIKLNRSRMSDIVFWAASLFGATPFSILRDRRRDMVSAIRSAAAGVPFDVIHIDQLNMAQYGWMAEAKARVLDQHNVVSELYCQIYGIKKWWNPFRYVLMMEFWKMRRYEAYICRKVDAVIVMTDKDKELILELTDSQANVELVPICVDTNRTPLTLDYNSNKILFVGTLHYAPNIDGLMWFCREVLPLIQRKICDAELIIVGSGSPKKIAGLDGKSHVQILGYVDDIDTVARSCVLTVVPLQVGSGMRVKILNSLAMGLPVVSTSVGCEGINTMSGQAIMVADEPDIFAEKVVGLLSDRKLGLQMAENGRAMVKAKNDWSVVYKKLDYVYEIVTA